MGSKITITDAIPYEMESLAKGNPVALSFAPTGHTIFLTPGHLYGLDDNALIIAGLGAKCGVIDIRHITLTPLLQAGLVAPAAQILRRELERTYRHADQTTIQQGATRRKAQKEQSDNRGRRKKANRRRAAKNPAAGR